MYRVARVSEEEEEEEEKGARAGQFLFKDPPFHLPPHRGKRIEREREEEREKERERESCL